MSSDLRLFSYKMAVDTGFAPNPFFGVLTLATCKPKIRLCKQVNDWIAGFTSKALCGHKVGKERLIYLMQITDKIKISEYFNHPHYKLKIPDHSNEETVYRAGDNIYYKTDGANFEQIKNWNHDEGNKDADTSGIYVLISNKFYYFGGKPLQVPDCVRPKIPKGQSAHGALSDNQTASAFIEWVKQKGEGVHNAPHTWKSGDSSWNKLLG